MTATALPLFGNTLRWGWRRYGRAHAYSVLPSGELVALCSTGPDLAPTTTGAPSRRRCAHCLRAIHRVSTRREGTSC